MEEIESDKNGRNKKIQQYKTVTFSFFTDMRQEKVLN
jgi:hypothetical protein